MTIANAKNSKRLTRTNKISVQPYLQPFRLVRPINAYFRTRRMRDFQKLFNITSETRILDVGGTTFIWSLLQERPQISILNLFEPQEFLEDNINWVVGNGTNLPFKSGEFDIVFSNSVIEHLGDLSAQEKFAKEITRAGTYYYVQTPNRWFPVEPHFMTPFIHFLPKSWQKRLVKNFTLWGLSTRPSTKWCGKFVDEIQLLDYKTMKKLFPDAQIFREKFFGITKSLIAVKYRN